MKNNLERLAADLKSLTFDEMMHLADCLETSVQGCLEDCPSDELTGSFFATTLTDWAADQINGDPS